MAPPTISLPQVAELFLHSTPYLTNLSPSPRSIHHYKTHSIPTINVWIRLLSLDHLRFPFIDLQSLHVSETSTWTPRFPSTRAVTSIYAYIVGVSWPLDTSTCATTSKWGRKFLVTHWNTFMNIATIWCVRGIWKRFDFYIRDRVIGKSRKHCEEAQRWQSKKQRPPSPTERIKLKKKSRHAIRYSKISVSELEGDWGERCDVGRRRTIPFPNRSIRIEWGMELKKKDRVCWKVDCVCSSPQNNIWCSSNQYLKN